MESEKKEEMIKNTVVLKRIIVKHNPDFYKKVKKRVLQKGSKFSWKMTFLSVFIGNILGLAIYFLDSREMSWIKLLSIVAMFSVFFYFQIYAWIYFYLQKDFDKLLNSLNKEENEEDKDFFITFMQKNLFTACDFTREDFNKIFDEDPSKESAVIKEALMVEVENFFEAYIESVNF